MWKCENCGQLSDGKFCGTCGSKAPENPENGFSHPAGNAEINTPADNCNDDKTIVFTPAKQREPVINNPQPSEMPISENNNAQNNVYRAPVENINSQNYDCQSYVYQQYDEDATMPLNNGFVNNNNPQPGSQQQYDNVYGNYNYQQQNGNVQGSYDYQQQNGNFYGSYDYQQQYGNVQQNYDSGYYGTSYNTDAPKKSSNKTIIIIISVLVAILLGLSGVAAYLVLNDTYTSVDDSQEDNNADESDNADDNKDTNNNESDKDDINEFVFSSDVNKISNTKVEEIISANSSYTDFNIYVKNLSSGYEYKYAADKDVLASAMVQIVVIDTVLDMAKSGEVDVNNDKYMFSYIHNGKRAPSSEQQDGSMLTIEDYIKDVAEYGDNNKSNHLIDFIGEVKGESSGQNAINKRLSKLKYTKTTVNRKTFIDPLLVDTSVEPNTTSAYDIGRIFENLINNDVLGDKEYMLSLFKSTDDKGEPIGLKKYIPEDYTSGNVNAMTDQTTSNVSYICNDGTDIIVAILSNADESKTDIENNAKREEVQKMLLEYILETQF